MTPFILVHGATEVRLVPGCLTIGRSPSCAFPVADSLVSREHAVLRVDADEVVIVDLESANGVYVNGTRIRGEQPLEPGDRVVIGGHEFVLKYAEIIRLREDTPTAEAPAFLEPAAMSSDIAALSPRERQVLRYLAYGHSQREVAEILGLSPKTVETYRSHLVHKLGLRSRAQLVRFALAAGVLTPTAG